METRRTFLKISLSRMLVLGILFSFRPARLAWGRTQGVDLSQPGYSALVDELVSRYQFSKKDLRLLFGKAVLRPEIIEKFEKPPELLPYYEYRRRFIRDEMIVMSRQYLSKNLAVFERVEESFGVEKEIICSILGIESKFGQAGIQNYRVFDVLNTAFSSYPRRTDFYRAELIAFLLLCREERLDPLEVKGSYAGAFGVPQFMPSSFRRYAVDFDHNGKRDLIDSIPDILASVANYLRSFGWRHNGLLWLNAVLVQDTPEAKQILGSGLHTATPVARLRAIGIKIESSPEATEEASLVTYESKVGEESLVAAFGNFRAITHYNSSTNYALAVIELARILSKGTAE